MVVWLVAQRDPLFPELLVALSVDVQAGTGLGQRVVLKDPAHVVEQAGDRQHYGGRTDFILPLQEELGVLVSLGGGTAEPNHCLGLVVSHSLPCQVQLAQHVLGVLVARLR